VITKHEHPSFKQRQAADRKISQDAVLLRTSWSETLINRIYCIFRAFLHSFLKLSAFVRNGKQRINWKKDFYAVLLRTSWSETLINRITAFSESPGKKVFHGLLLTGSP
jgi:hypothetical protein